MPRTTIAAIWIAGLLLALLVYAAGPERFAFAAFEAMQRAWWAAQGLLRNLSIAAFDVVQAVAIGLYFVFVALGLLAVRRGGRGWGALVVVSLIFFGLVWHDPGHGFGSHTRWVAALVLAGLGALGMTRRLTHPPAAGSWRPGSLPPRP